MKYFFITIGVSVSFFLLFPGQGFAAEFYFGAKEATFAKAQPVEIGLFLNTEGETVNAIEGKIQYQDSEWEFQEIRDGETIVNFWLERPQEPSCATLCEIKFSGIIPGGYTSPRGFLFSMVLVPKISGKISLKTSGERVLLHDGIGNTATIRQAPLILETSDTQPVINEIPPFFDTTPPETFSPEISHDPNIFNEDYFLVFATQDKGAGMDYFEVMEKGLFGGGFLETESPYRLKDQGLHKDIWIKAVDKAGNVRVSIIPAKKPLAWYLQGELWVIIVFVLYLWILLRKHFQKK